MSFGPLNSDGGERRLNVLILERSSVARCFRQLPATTLTFPDRKEEAWRR
jgi:hypothetical protein